MNEVKTICISRIDSIGDVILTLPMATILKENYPNSKILFLGRSYTKAIVEKLPAIDEVLIWDELANKDENEKIEFLKAKKIDTFIHVFPNKELASLVKLAQIPNRIGTSRRLYHLFTCNEKVSLSRKKSDLHEAQLNVKLLAPLVDKTDYKLDELAEKIIFQGLMSLSSEHQKLIDPTKTNIILHPLSQGSAVEWGLENYEKLISLLPKDEYKIFVSGTEKESRKMKDFLERNNEKITNVTGMFSLNEFISFIDACDALVACSTGPLHIASVLRKKAIGLFSVSRPIHPGRWRPIGRNSVVVVNSKGELSDPVEEITSISPDEVFNKIHC